MERGLMIGEWTIYPSDLKNKGLIAKIMWDIVFCDPHGCRDKEAHLELLEHTAKEIIERVKEVKDEKQEGDNWGI